MNDKYKQLLSIERLVVFIEIYSAVQVDIMLCQLPAYQVGNNKNIMINVINE